MVTQLVGGLCSAMGYTGCHNIKEFQERPGFCIMLVGSQESTFTTLLSLRKPPITGLSSKQTTNLRAKPGYA